MALVLDRRTGLVSPQFHIKFDPSFQTVKSNNFDSQWQLKTGFVGIRVKEPIATAPNALERSAPSEGAQNAPSEGAQKRQRFEHLIDREQNSEINRQLQRHNMKQAPELGKTHEDEQVGKQTPIPETEIRPPVERLIEAMLAEVKILTKEGIEGEIFCLEAMFPIKEVAEHPLTVFKATSDPDTMYLHQAMKDTPTHDQICPTSRRGHSHWPWCRTARGQLRHAPSRYELEDDIASSAEPGLANFGAAMLEPLEARGRGFTHGHKKVMGCPNAARRLSRSYSGTNRSL